MGIKGKIQTIAATEIEQLIARLESRRLLDPDYQVLIGLVRLVGVLQGELESKHASIAKLRRLLFGPRSEKRPLEPPPVLEPEQTEVKSGTTETANNLDPTDPEPKVVPLERKRKPGHGRNGAAAYTGAKVVACDHGELHPGDGCPDPLCRGHLYDTKTPKFVLHFEGRPPVDVTRYDRQSLRCSACQTRFTAPLPEGVPDQKYNPSADVVMALLKYGGGLPFYRLSRLQAAMGIPLPPSTQFERCEQVADALHPIYLELQRQAAKGELWHVDDTWLRILQCVAQHQPVNDKERTGLFTTGLVAKVAEGAVALYFSGRRHAGENLAFLNQLRPPGLPLPLVMGDAEAKNWSTQFEKIILKCLVHGRRQFVEIEPHFPTACKRVLDDLAAVYTFEAETKALTPEARLAYHQANSQPVLEALKTWMEAQLEQREVEPNSRLGKAMTYMLNHWFHLTQFLRVKNAPLDNNAAERILRRVVLHRKNALFFKTAHGAAIADVLSSVIETCALTRINAFDYLVTVMRHAREVRGRPSDWLPWNYHEQLKLKAA